MFPPGRPKGEFLSAQRAGQPMFPPGRPKGESWRAQRAVSPITAPGRSPALRPQRAARRLGA